MKQKLIRFLNKLGVRSHLRDGFDSSTAVFRLLLWNVFRCARRVDSRLTKAHLLDQPDLKLHLGCGENILPGWVNSDLFPDSNEVLHLDASLKFPFEDDVCSCVFSEHMIEHIPYAAATNMVAESFRVLRAGGIFRVSTPDIRFLIELFNNQITKQQEPYIEFEIERNDAVVRKEEGPTFALNHFVRAWGHMFIHSEETLRAIIERAGFANIEKRTLNDSPVPELRELEHESRMPEGFLQLQSITLEATKPRK